MRSMNRTASQSPLRGCRSRDSRRTSTSSKRNSRETQTRWKKLMRWLCDSWALEYAATLFSFLCLLGAISLLFRFGGAPVSKWRFYLSLNTVLSILATAMRSSVLLSTASALSQLKWTWSSGTPRRLRDFQTFDEASRGPFGALKLLAQSPPSTLAALGALVTLCSMASDAFVQASASQGLRIENSTDASISVCRNYSIMDGNFHASPLWQSALYAGVFSADGGSANLFYDPVDYGGTNSSAPIASLCRTGNCTFASYTTLATRHQCSNITSTISTQILNSNGTTWRSTINGPGGSDLSVETLMTANSFYQNTEIVSSNLSNYMTMSTTDYLYITNLSVPVGENQEYPYLPVLDVYILVTPSTSNLSSSTEAYHCNISLGIEEFQGTLTNGVLTETSLDYVPGPWIDGGTLIGDFLLLQAIVHGEMQEVQIGHQPWVDIWQNTAASFDGSYSSYNLWLVGNLPTNDIIAGVYANYDYSSDPAYQTAAMDATFKSISSSINRYLRVATNEKAHGVTHELVPYIEARWGFLLLPVAVVVGSCVLVFLTSRQSRRLGVPNWRNSVLAMLYSKMNVGGLMKQDACVELGPGEEVRCVSQLEDWGDGRWGMVRRNEGDCKERYAS